VSKIIERFLNLSQSNGQITVGPFLGTRCRYRQTRHSNSYSHATQ